MVLICDMIFQIVETSLQHCERAYQSLLSLGSVDEVASRKMKECEEVVQDTCLVHHFDHTTLHLRCSRCGKLSDDP